MPLMQMHNENNKPFDFSVMLIPQTPSQGYLLHLLHNVNKYRGLLQLLH